MEESEKADSEPIPTNDDASPSQGKSCALCGCATPAVRCDRCNSQIFCLSCDDMYHRHPKRKLHLRKAVDSIWTTARSPRLRRRTELPGDPCKIPIPPPRSKKREHRTIGSRTFLKTGLELGSFGHSKVFSPSSKDFFAGQKSPASMVESNCDDGTPSPNVRPESGQIYENDNITNTTGNLDDRSPWNPRPNISSPIQVSIPSSSPDIVANGQSFGYPAKPHSQSAADLTAHTGHPVGHHPYHFHPPYPYMHPPVHPYSHSMAHLNCAQCISSSWSNLISPHPSPYFHPMPWGSAQNTLSRPPVPGHPPPMKHSHGDLPTYPESGFHYPYPGAPYYHNGVPVVDPHFIKDLHEQAEMQKQRKEAKPSPRHEEMDVVTNPSPMPHETSTAPSAAVAAESTEAVASTNPDAQAVEETPAVPEKPTEPWSCLHCTFINPPGIHICQVCCKTSYGNKHSGAAEEEQSEARPLSRDSESPLINRDALMNSPGVSEIRDAQKDFDVPVATQASAFETNEEKTPTEKTIAAIKLTTETQTFTTTKTTDVQTQNIFRKSIASSTDSIFPRQESSVQTEIESLTKHCSVATDPMISSQSLESLLSGVSAPPYHNRRAGWGRGATSFSTQSLYERGRSRSPMPRSLSFHTEAAAFGRDSSFASEEAMHSASQAWLYADPMYYKPHNKALGQSLGKEDYFDGTWGSMDRLNHRVKHKKDKEKLEVRPKFHRSLDDLKSEKKPEFIHTHELMMLQTVKEAERCGFTLEDLHVAYLHCGKENPVFWLEDNWPQMIKNVIGLAAKYGEENEENDVGAITTTEAKEALRIHRGDIWDAVAECIETRQRKILELTVRGNFTQKQISEVLKNNEGNVELAYADLLRASTKRHKFILSPGLSTDSEDLNVYNPTEESSADHTVSLSPLKAAKLDVTAESKSEKKKSDFLTKLTAIREAQSERRKAREEKELIRETITQDLPIPAETEDVLKVKNISFEVTPSMSREDSKEVEEILQGGMTEPEEVLPEAKLERDVSAVKEVSNPKEIAEDSIPVDFDTNWSESQGEWIEEYSDEHWEEGDEHWVGLGKKFQKMQKEFEEEAMQMAALWEKEELEDDVFEEESKVQQEVEVAADSDKKFDDWVKANLKVDSSEYEEEIERKGKPQDENINNVLIRERLELEGSQPSPLQHYPTAFDLSLKSQFESDWVDLPADAEIEKLAHDIVCEGSDIENKFDEGELVMSEEERHLRRVSDQGSDEDWEKIEIDEQLREVNELDNFAFPEKEGEFERGTDEEILEISDADALPSKADSEIIIEKDSTVLYKNVERVKAADASDVGIIASELSGASDMASVTDTTKLISPDNNLPKAPARRKSKLSSTDIEDVLKSQPTTEISSDIPPPLPEKTRQKDDQQKGLDIYAVPDKTTKISKLEDHISNEFEKDLSSVPPKPPRLNLSPTMAEESMQKKSSAEKEAEISPKALNKESSPLSYESDSNFFADSESDTEIKLNRQKNIHRKLAKYENEFEEFETKDISVEKIAKRTVREKKDVTESSLDLERKLEKSTADDVEDDVVESNFDLELDEDIDPSLIEPLPRMIDIDYDPELPILLGGRGRQLGDIDDVNAPKAFREDTTRPLQLFKATKREIPVDTMSMPSPTSAESPVAETSFIQRISDELPMPASISNIPHDVSTIHPEVVSENQAKDTFYYNDTVIPQQSFADSQASQLQPQETLLRKEETEKEIEPIVQPVTTPQEEEMTLTEIESLSAVADYFFGRYNEITVTPPKKKTPARPKPVTSASSKLPSKVMSSSEIASVPHPESTSQMDQSAAAVLEEEKPLQEDSQSRPAIIKSNQQKEQVVKQNVTESSTSLQEKPKPPTECLSFAEDYLFGCYNQVVPPRKTKNVSVISAKIPKFAELSASSRPQSPLKEQKPITPVSTPEPPEVPLNIQEEEELVEEEVPEEDENDTSIRTDISAIYDDEFHDLPPELLSNQSFDETSIYYESFQDAIEDVQSSSMIDGSLVNVRPKSVHFEVAESPVVPPRRNKARSLQKAKVPPSSESSESYANEYLFRQYEPVSQAKKKLPLCSEDFRMNQGFEPAEIPSDTFLSPDDDEEEDICSETSVEIPSKSNKLFKSSSEYDFRESEQPLDLIEYDTKETELKNSEIYVKSENSILHSQDSPFLEEKNLESISSSFRQDDVVSTDIQSEKSESFEELSIPDNLEEVIEKPHVSEELYTVEKNEILSDPLLSTITESEIVNAQQAQSYDAIANEASNRLEMDQFVFIEQAQDIIDDSYNLYDIQDSLTCDLNYVDIKGNIEDECTDDSEQEWKRNEDRKNTLNASFLTNAPITKLADDDEKIALDESQQCDRKETMLHKSQNEAEAVLSGAEKLDIEEIEDQEPTMDESDIAYGQDERKNAVDPNLMKDFESTEIPNEDYEFSKQSEDVYIENQFSSTEMYDDEFNKVAGIVSEGMNEGLTESSQDVYDAISSIDDEFQIISDDITTESFEDLTEKIDKSLSEIEKELSESVSYMPVECDDILSEDLSVIKSVSELSDAISTNEEIELESFPEEIEISESDDTAVTEGTKLESPEIENAFSETYDEEIKSESSEVEIEVSETGDAGMEEVNKLQILEEKTNEVTIIEEDTFLPEDQQMYVLEDFEASDELSDDNVSTHSSVSTQIAVSMKIALKEFEGDESSLNLEQLDNLEDDSEISQTRSVTVVSQTAENIEQTISETDISELDEREEIAEVEFLKEQEYGYETENFENDNKIESEECRNEVTPIPSFVNESYVESCAFETSVSGISGNLEDNLDHDKKEAIPVTDKAISESIYSDENFELKEEIIDNKIMIGDETEITYINEYDKVKDDILSFEGSLCTENVVPEIIETVDSESKSNEFENDEIEALMAEESIITHFYDEWYQADASTKFSLLSAESIYAKYGTAESSESGNESDNASSAADSKDITNETVTYQNEKSIDNQILEKDIKDFDDDSVKLPLMKDILCEKSKWEVTDTYQESATSDISEVRNEVVSADISSELQFEPIKDNEQTCDKDVEDSVVRKEIEISSIIERKTESVILHEDVEMSIQSFKEQESSDSKIVTNKFSTSKSCQTEDSFEEDIFFDSFDDTFTIPSYIHLPIESQTKPPSTDISIQCELISIDDILSSKKIFNISQTEVITAQTQIVLSKDESTNELKLSGEEPKESELASEEKEESSCESFEDSDSDLFIESPSSQDELDVGARRGLLYAEVDSDTGFSSGSEYGWTKKSDYKQKELKKVSYASSTSKIISLQTSSSEENVISADDIQEKTLEVASITEKRMAADINEKDVEILSDSARSSPFPPEIIERAITPVAIPQFPSFEDDLIFVEVKETIEEVKDSTEEEAITTISTTPTVEYFYGPLPETVKIESPPDSNERFFETASELSESASHSADRTESFSDSSFSLPSTDRMSPELNIDNKATSITKNSEDSSLAETISLKGETEDSISEYYSFPESSVSLISRASLAESDIFDFAQNEFFTDDDILVDLNNFSSKEEEFTDEELVLPVCEINKTTDATTTIKSIEKHPEEISSFATAVDAEEIKFPSDISPVTEHTKSPDDQSVTEKEDEHLLLLETDPSAEIQKTVSEALLIDSKTVLSTEESQVVESTESESVASNIIKASSDVPPVPSDIVRYLYYDDSITFDDESYHTQSGSVEVPSLTSQDTKPVDSTDKTAVNETNEKIPVSEVCAISSAPVSTISEEEIAIPTMESENSCEFGEKLHGKSFETDVLGTEETPAILEASQEKIGSTADVLSDNIADLGEKAPDSKLSENVQPLTETDLKFSSIEVLPSESITVLPSAREQTLETVVFKEESVGGSIIVSDTSFEQVATLTHYHEQQDVVESIDSKQISTDVPPVPSDIVRYLYYDDDITFDEMTESSFHSQYDNGISELEGEELPIETAEYSDLKPVEHELLQNVAELSELSREEPHLIAQCDTQHELSDVSFEESSYKPDSGNSKDESHDVPFDSSEYFENWFDLRETTGVMKHHDNEQYSSTRSSVLKEDSEQPCIPEYILSPKLSNDIPVGKTDVDEITDISTHFTMTDDSDRFSDIDNDISLNSEEECFLPIEISDQIQIDQFEDKEFFESCIKSDDEILLSTPEVEYKEEECQFLTPEPLQGFPEQEKVTESISSKEIAEDIDQQILGETKPEFSELKEKSDKCIISADSSELVKQKLTDSLPVSELSEELDKKEIDQRHSSNEFKEKSEAITEKFDECITSTSEVSKEEFEECPTSSELLDQKFDRNLQKGIGEVFDECITSTEISEISKEQFEECLSSSELLEGKKEKDDKIIVDEISKEQFEECPTSSEQLEGKKVKDADEIIAEISKEQSEKSRISSELTEGKTVEDANEIMAEIPSKEFPEQLSDYIGSDENGNFPESIVKKDTVQLIELKDEISEEILETSPVIKELISSPADKSEVIAGVLAEDYAHSESSHIIHEAEMFAREELDLNLNQTEATETVSTDKDDLETSSHYTLPIEESHSISEVSDNWSDSDGRYIEEDESVYDIPLENINNICSGISVIADESSEKSAVLEADIVNLEPFPSESKVTDSKAIDASVSESVSKETDFKIIKTVNVLDFKCDVKEITEDSSMQFITSTENRQSELDDSHESQKISEVEKTFVTNELTKAVDVTQSDIFESDNSSEQNSKQTHVLSDSLLSSEMKPIQEVKLETESKFSSTIEEKIPVECMSTTPGAEPEFSPDETHDSKDVQSDKISSKELCLEEEVISSSLSHAYCEGGSSEDKIQSSTAEEETRIICDADSLENSSVKTMETKPFEISDSEVKYFEITPIPDLSKSKESSLNNIQSEENVEELIETNLEKDTFLGTRAISEAVDFKGSITVDESFRKKVSTAAIIEETESKVTQSEKCVFSSDTAIPCEIVDFKGELSVRDFSNLKTEVVDKSCDDKSEQIIIDKKESKTGVSSESFEVVDFKMIMSEEITEKKSEKKIVDLKRDEKFTDSKVLDSALNVKEGSFETVDFKGQIINLLESEKDVTSAAKFITIEERESIREAEISKPIELEKHVVTEESSNIQKDRDFHKVAKTSETYEAVDFKGQLTIDRELLEPEEENIAVCTTNMKFVDKDKTFHKDEETKQVDVPTMSKTSEQIPFDTSETVDFKGCLSADELRIQSEDQIRKDTQTSKDSHREKLESDTIKKETSKEVVDFKGIIDESVTYDSQEIRYSFHDEQAISTYDPQEIYSYDIVEQTVMFDPRETYGFGYGFDEQAVTSEFQETFSYGAVEESEIVNLQQQSHDDEVTDSKSIDYISLSEESNELCSYTETLSAASDASLQFHSFSNDLEDALNVSTSEDFTDVPSHLTSTDESDKWSDVEGDFSLEDAEYDRDKTPTRTPYGIITPVKEEFKSDASDAQLSKSLTELVGVRHEETIISDSERQITSASEQVISDLSAKFEKVDTDRIEIESDSQNIKEAKQEIFEHEEITKTEAVSMLTESEVELKLSSDREISNTYDSLILQPVEGTELFSAAETDISVITGSENLSDVTSYLSAEDSDKLLYDEIAVHTQVEEPEICATDVIKLSEELIPKVETASVKSTSDIQTASDDTLTPLMEHFADIKSLNDPLTTPTTFTTIDIETAVSKTHEDINSGILSQSEKTESEQWLEAETEHSISEISEDIAVCIEKDGDTKFIFVDYEKPVENIDTTNESSGTPHTSTTSTSSSYSDFENSDHTSDTYADISLQGATSENSDKWSDFEAEGLIDDVLYGNIDIPNTAELTDFSQLIKKPNENRSSAETPTSEDQLKAIQDVESVTDISSDEIKNDTVNIITERTSDSLKVSEHDRSVKSSDFSSDNISDVDQTLSTKETSILSSSLVTKVSVALSDDDFTDITPLEVTAEASDKLSDISDDTSLGDNEDESSISLKAYFKAQDQESVITASECKTDSSSKYKENECINLELKPPQEDNIIKEIHEEISIQSNIQLQQSSDALSREMPGKELDIPVVEVHEKLDEKLTAFVEQLSTIDKTEEESSPPDIELEESKIKYTELSTDSFTIKSSETAEQVDFKFEIQNVNDIPRESKFSLGEKEQISVLSKELAITEVKGVEASSQLTDSFSVDSTETFAERVETVISQTAEETKSSEKDFQVLKTDFKLKVQTLDAISSESKHCLSEEEFSHSIEEKSDTELKLSLDTETKPVTTEETTKLDVTNETESKETIESYVKDKIDLEESSSSKITDDSETLDNFTDVPTHTVTSETSDAYLDLDNDYSFEEIESLHVEAENVGLQGVQIADSPSLNEEDTLEVTAQSGVEYYENSLSPKDILEEADDFALDAIPENELENYEEEEYSLSEHFEINEDELIYPLPYSDDWIEQSFELKEYGVEAEFYESETDIHGLGVVNEEYDDEDIQRAIDYNLSTFDENEENVENVISTDSFKTLSHDSSPHLKPDEYETWSTADAPSIEEEFEEQDNILSKIDEILAEDFGDLGMYQADSYLKHDEYTEDYLSRDIDSPGDKCDDGFIQRDNIGLPKPDSEITSAEITPQEDSAVILRTMFVKKDTIEEFKFAPLIKETSISDSKSSQEIDSKLISDKTIQKTITKESKIESDTMASDVTVDKHFITTESLPSEITIKKDSFKAESEEVSAELTIKRDSKPQPKSDSETISKVIIPKKESFKADSEDASAELTLKSDSKPQPKSDSETISNAIILKKESEKVSKAESEFAFSETSLDKDSIKESKIETDSISTETTVKKDYAEIHKTKSEAVSSEISVKKGFKPEPKPDSEIITDEIALKKDSEKSSIVESDVEVTLHKDSVSKRKIESDSVSAEIALKKDDAKMLKTKSEVVSGEISIKDEFKREVKQVSETVFEETTLKKGSKLELKSDSDVVSGEITLKKGSEKSSVVESDAASYEVALDKDSLREHKIESDSVSAQITLKEDSKKASRVESDVASHEVTLMKDSYCEPKVEPDSVSGEVIVKKESAVALKTDSEAASHKISIKKDSESELKLESETLKKSSGKDSRSESDIVSSEISMKKESIRETKLVTDTVYDEMTLKKESEQTFKSKEDTPEEKKLLLQSTDEITEVKQISSIIETSSQSKTIATASEVSIEHKDISSSADVSTSVISSSSDTPADKKGQFSENAESSVLKTDLSVNIPLPKPEETQNELSVSCKLRKESEDTEILRGSQLSESVKSASESTELQLNIPKQKEHKDETFSVLSETSTISKEQTSSDSLVVEVKPDIPKKSKRKSLDLTEVTPLKVEHDEKPSLPPKKSKRHSLTDSGSSSIGDSLSSSSSAESIGSFESAVLEKSGKSSSKSSDETSMHSLPPEAPTRRSRSSKTSSSSRSTSRDSDDNSSCSRSSSLKIRRRSSNFAEPEPIDLSKKRASIDERMKKLQIEGKCTTKEKAFIAAKLIEMQFEEEDALLASRQCNTVYNAVKFLTQLCDMCKCRFPINLMSSLVNCAHRACKECLRAHFTSLIYDRSVFTLLCPICHKPDITDQNIQEYFIHLDMTLKNILEDKVYDLFQRKLRDEVLTKDPNFHWCSQCSSGFIASPRLKKLYCPDCSAITCAMCHETWEMEHEGVHCERFQQWKDMHTPEPPPAGLVKLLTDRGISCPSCGLLYAQACGGCMMYKCSHCSFEFCGFCIQPLKKGRECSNEICDSRGHHIHHLHNCLFFLRDKDVTEIQMLLEEESITYLTIPPKDQIVKSRCQVREQKYNHGIIIEDRCGRAIEPYCAGLCRTHYYEYLAELLRKNKISPLSIMTIQDLQFMLRKSRIFVPEKVKGETSEDYYERLLEFVSKNLT